MESPHSPLTHLSNAYEVLSTCARQEHKPQQTGQMRLSLQGLHSNVCGGGRGGLQVTDTHKEQDR